MQKIYRDQNADIKYIRNKQILIIGYGSQGRAFALNLRDSAIEVNICIKLESLSANAARAEGLKVITPDNIDDRYDIFLFMIPDHLQGDFYEKYIKNSLKENSCLVFAHGYSIQFGLVRPDFSSDVILVAPHGPGDDLRERFIRGSGISCYVAVQQDHSGEAANIALALAKAVGSTRIGAFQTTFEHETLGDIFGEQALLCGGLAELVTKSYEALVRNGIPEENAYIETAHQIDLLASLLKRHGIHGMAERISMTAQYGMLKMNDKIIDRDGEKRLNQLFEKIKSGEFARDWQEEYETGFKNLKEYKKKLKNHSIEKTAEKIKKIIE
ncbi:MAG TPA: ketol-acid reductoisomerase [candidate division Zixibacteria bacterium]|nr:ketol-acid reductoisomerase [candidate division Zixibacteria bacterium]HEQ99048.1 ketol-acid reductoisomerase [candidate division Zixibacteria bacterium]